MVMVNKFSFILSYRIFCLEESLNEYFNPLLTVSGSWLGL